MEPETIDGVRHALMHRIRAHRAALNAAEALGWPTVLGVAVSETEARLDEALVCLAAVDAAIGWDGLHAEQFGT